MNEIGLSWCPDVRTEKNPRLSARDQALAPVEIRGHSHERELVAAQRYEVAVACWPSPRHDSIISSQQTRRLPCSLTHCHQPLRGAMNTSGARFWSRPAIVAMTLSACAGVRLTYATTVASARCCACCLSHAPSTLEICSIGGPTGPGKADALLRNSPGFPPPVTRITAL